MYSPTVNLPITDFNIRAMAKQKEPEIQSFWESADVYNTVLAKNDRPYTLHDGPPYANGDLHIGHALNKIIKDIINKRKLLEGYKAKFVPGWDTHGLPIELKVCCCQQARLLPGSRSTEFCGIRPCTLVAYLPLGCVGVTNDVR